MSLNEDQFSLDDLEFSIEDFERRSVVRFAVPAEGHEAVGGLGGVVRTSQNFSLFQIFDDFLVRHAVVRLQGQTEDFPPGN